ncbi:hypothetical protein E2493_16115 [Sphingomonas parva]|uniref:Uncharacterized protein n=1 Tax=Sphingomonas parva TaxID=2555898 RepID=A0A4Y8ZQX1_9SPHN|nr:hypothetical protein [Sphingomonas parva]TFI57229.1 hypothetical protein E2493_16115 [Sphingomonas parva]
MSWFGQTMLTSTFVGTLVTLAAWLQWIPVKLGVGAALAYFVLSIARNPAMIYRRGFHLIVAASALPLGFSLRADAVGAAGTEAGFAHVVIDLSQSVSPWLWFGLAALCVLGDGLVALRETRARRLLYDRTEGDAHLLLNGSLVQTRVSLQPQHSLQLTGARLRLPGWFRGLHSELRVRRGAAGPALEASPQHGRAIAAGELVNLTVRTVIGRRLAAWLRFRVRAETWGLPGARGVLVLRADRAIEPLPVVIDAQPAPVRKTSARSIATEAECGRQPDPSTPGRS